MKFTAIIRAMLFVAMLATTVLAGAPQLIDYQGFLKDGSGNPVTGSLSFTFKIYTASTGGTQKWTETQNSISVTGGLFNVTLGASTPIHDTVFNQTDRWLGITVGGGSELSPRTRISSSAYGQRVATIDGASGGTVSGDITAGKGNFGSGNTNAGKYAFVAGINNTASGDSSSVTGGASNTASASFASVGGGLSNAASVVGSAITGGQGNRADGAWSFVGGGFANHATGTFSGVPSGYDNYAYGQSATVPGGEHSQALGICTFAAGYHAKAQYDGSFVWADYSTSTDFTSITSNSYNVRSSGGVRIYTNSGLTAGVTMAAGASAWSSVSDSTRKRNIRLVDRKDILTKLMSLPIKQWSYKAQDAAIEHVGPMAQDFYSTFKLGDDDKTISTIDPSGIALAAIQELNLRVEELKQKSSEIESLKSQLAQLQSTVDQLALQMARKSSSGSKTLSVVTETSASK